MSIDWKVQLFKLNYDDQEASAVSDVLNDRWLTMGMRTSEFESNFEKFLQNDSRCLAVSSCTAALHLALLALDIGPGDEVIIPALTFIADCNTVKMVGARPVLADSTSLDNWNICSKTIKKCITNRTKAVIVVHYAGFPCDMPSIVKLCRDNNLKIIEDVAHAPGASHKERFCGTWGDIGCFSFFSNKNLSVGEGGMLVTPSPDLFERLQKLRSHGMSSLTLDRHKGRAISYDVSLPGLNYRIDEMRAALGIVQLKKLQEANFSRMHLTNRYRQNFRGSSISMPFKHPLKDSTSSYHILPILLPNAQKREDIIKSLKSEGIQSSIHYPPFWQFSAFQGEFYESDAPVVAEISKRQLTLPLYPTMSFDEVDFVSYALLNCLM